MTTTMNAGGGDWLDLPTRPVQHRGARKPEGLPWAELTESYVAAGGQVDAGVWHQGKVRIIEGGRRGIDRIHTFVENDGYDESASAAPMRVTRRPVKRATPPTTRRTLTDAQRAEIAKRYVEGEHMPELAAAYGTGVGSVSWALKVHGVKPRTQAEARKLAKARNAS